MSLGMFYQTRKTETELDTSVLGTCS